MTEPTRGRIVMLVDNEVRFDSRVQKEAASAAERGWEVILLGKRTNRNDAMQWTLGEAKVRLIKVPGSMSQRRFEYRRGLLRSPFAYLPGPLAQNKGQSSKAWKADLRFRQADLAVWPKPLAPLRRTWLALVLFVAKVHGRWVSFRIVRTQSLVEHRAAMDQPIDRFTTKWWQRTRGNRAWRKLDPSIMDWELAFGPVIDKLKPDLIHANDFRMLAIGARAATRAKAAGRDVKLVWDAHEFLPGMRPWQSHPRWHLAQCALERDFAPYADVVVTVSEQLVDMIIDEHQLAEPPFVVLNAPIVHVDNTHKPTVEDIRRACGLGTETPLLVYSGLAAEKRGLDTMIDGLPLLDGVHVALVVSQPDLAYVKHLTSKAEKLGARDRLHIMPYVPVDDIVFYLSTADVGAIPVHHWPNHEISLGTKFFEYSHARLPILVSDVRAMADKVRETGQGEVFVAEDLDDYVRAVKALLADKERYVRAYDAPGLLEAWTWERQADELDRIYTNLHKH